MMFEVLFIGVIAPYACSMITVVKAFTASSGEMFSNGSTKCTISSFSGRSRMEEKTGRC
jgi:hypothetical protein